MDRSEHTLIEFNLPLTIIVEQIDAIKKHENQLFYAATVDYLFKN